MPEVSQRPSFRQPNDAETLTNTYENRLKSCRLFAGVNAMNRTRDLHPPAWVPTAFRVPWDGHFWPDDHHVDLPTRRHSGSVTTHFDDRQYPRFAPMYSQRRKPPMKAFSLSPTRHFGGRSGS